jgi:soluble lytic murein transglycosylase-like protein
MRIVVMLVRCALALVFLCSACSRRSDAGAATSSAPPPSRAEIWEAIQPLATRYRIEPGFIYALVAAESNFNPRARNGEAAGLFQLKPSAWRAVSQAPYEPTVWNWRKNLETGIDYLAYSRAYLHKKNVFSYPLLLAAFHYGLDYVEERKFDLRRIAVPENEIYQQLWTGNLNPVPSPISPQPR